MTISDVIELSLVVALVIFLTLLLVALVPKAVRWFRGRSWSSQLPHPLRFFAFRGGIALFAGVTTFVLVSAALTLNSHRPPGEVTPVIKVQGSDGPTTVHLGMNECGDEVNGTVTVRGKKPARASIYSDQDGLQPIPMSPRGRGRFVLSDPTSKRGLLSCYLQLPVVGGSSGPVTVKLAAGPETEVDTVASVPAPSGYFDGEWLWACPAGEKCPALATAGLAIEEGAKQVIVLVLAALFGSVIALFIGEALIEPVRRRLDRSPKD